MGVCAPQRSIISFMILWYGHHVGRVRIQRLPERFRFPHTRRILAWNVPRTPRQQGLRRVRRAGAKPVNLLQALECSRDGESLDPRDLPGENSARVRKSETRRWPLDLVSSDVVAVPNHHERDDRALRSANTDLTSSSFESKGQCQSNHLREASRPNCAVAVENCLLMAAS